MVMVTVQMESGMVLRQHVKVCSVTNLNLDNIVLSYMNEFCCIKCFVFDLKTHGFTMYLIVRTMCACMTHSVKSTPYRILIHIAQSNCDVYCRPRL